MAEADHLFGGNGSDWADYDNAGAAVTVNLRNDTSGGRAAGDTYDSIENVQGSDFDDTLVAGLNGKAFGGWGDDFVYDGTGTEILRGERGADHLMTTTFSALGGRPARLLRPRSQSRHGHYRRLHPEHQCAGDRFWLQEGQFNIAHNANGTLTAGQIFNTNDFRRDHRTQRLIFDTDAGDKILYYDADGSGSAAPVAIAKIIGLAAIVHTDFWWFPTCEAAARAGRHRAQGGGSGARVEVSLGEERTISVSVRSMPSTALTTEARKASSMRVFLTRTFRR